DPAAEPGLVEPDLAEPALADWTDPVAAPDRSGLADPLGVAESDLWSARAASAPGYAAGADPPCPAARPVRADFGAFGLWSLLSGRAAIGPVTFLAGPAETDPPCPAARPALADFGALGLWSLLSGHAAIGPAAATIATVAFGRRRRVARPA